MRVRVRACVRMCVCVRVFNQKLNLLEKLITHSLEVGAFIMHYLGLPNTVKMSRPFMTTWRTSTEIDQLFQGLCM